MMRRIAELGGKRAPFLRWSALRMVFGGRNLLKNWQVGDGREQALLEYVEKHAAKGDAAEVVRVIDEFCYRRSIMMNVGDEKGAILDAALAKVDAGLVLELGTYCGYSALRMSEVIGPRARLVSVEFSADNAAIARKIWDHAGVGDRLTVVVGHLGDGGATADLLEKEHGFGHCAVDFAFVDHAKERLPARPAAGARPRRGCTTARSWWPTTSSCPERRSTGRSCTSTRGSTGGRSSMRRTWSTRLCSKISSSKSTYTP